MDKSSSLWIAAGVLVAIGVAHSWLGERKVLAPLFASRGWGLSVASRPQAQSLLRFAWHLTTLAWLGLCAVLVGAPVALTVGAVALVSGGIIFFSLRGHLAWPLFVLSGMSALHAGGFLPMVVVQVLIGLAVAIALGASAVHAYWAAGGSRGLLLSVPQHQDGRPLFSPGRPLCALVALVLLGYAGVLGLGLRGGASGIVSWLLGAAGLLLSARLVGDGKYVGFSKRHRSTAFGRADDHVFTPLVVLLWLGTLAALS